jgi:hypothetical protein
VVLGGEDVAGRPGDLGTEGLEGLDEDGGLDGCGGVKVSVCAIEMISGSLNTITTIYLLM